MGELEKRSVENRALQVVADNKVTLIRAGAVVGGVAFLGFSAPVIIAAASAGYALMAIGAMALVGVGFFQAMPLIGQKWENKLLAMRKAEARANPVEQLQNRYIAKSKSFDKFKGAMKIIAGQINRLTEMIEQRGKIDPQHDLGPERRALEKMKKFYQSNLEKGKMAEKALLDFGKAIERYQFQYNFAQQGRTVFAGLKSAGGGDVQEEMLSDVAIGEIEQQFDNVYGELEVEAVFGQAQQIQSNAPSNESAIEAEFTDIAEDAATINNRRTA